MQYETQAFKLGLRGGSFTEDTRFGQNAQELGRKQWIAIMDQVDL